MPTDPAGKERWADALENGSALEKVRARQMIELAEQGPLEEFVEELAQLVILEITVLGSQKFKFYFMDGSTIELDLSKES